MVTFQELDEIVKRLKVDRSVKGINDEMRTAYDAAIDRLVFLANSFRQDPPLSARRW